MQGDSLRAIALRVLKTNRQGCTQTNAPAPGIEVLGKTVGGVIVARELHRCARGRAGHMDDQRQNARSSCVNPLAEAEQR